MPFRNSKSLKIELNEYGSYLGRDAGCFELRNKEGKVKHYPHWEKEIGEPIKAKNLYEKAKRDVEGYLDATSKRLNSLRSARKS